MNALPRYATTALLLLAIACRDDVPTAQSDAESIADGPLIAQLRTEGPPRGRPLMGSFDPSLTHGAAESDHAVSADVGTLVPINQVQVDIAMTDTLTGDRGFLMRFAGSTSSRSFSPLGNVPTEWILEALADFNGDQNPDILWRNSITGEVGTWLLSADLDITGWHSWGAVPLDWSIRGAADMNGNGSPDILWRNNVSGENGTWLLTNTTLSGYHSFGQLPLEWSLLGGCDAVDSPAPDLIWFNTATLELAVWQMNGLTLTGFAAFNSPPSNYAPLDIVGRIPSATVPARCGPVVRTTNYAGRFLQAGLSRGGTAVQYFTSPGRDNGNWVPSALGTLRRRELAVASIQWQLTSADTLVVGAPTQLNVILLDSLGQVVTGRAVTFRSTSSVYDILGLEVSAGGLVTARLAHTCYGVVVTVENVASVSPCIRARAMDRPTAVQLIPNTLTVGFENTSANSSHCGTTAYQAIAYRVLRADGQLARGGTVTTTGTTLGDGASRDGRNNGTYRYCFPPNTLFGATATQTVTATTSATSAVLTLHVVSGAFPLVQHPVARIGDDWVVSWTNDPTATRHEVFVEQCAGQSASLPVADAVCQWINVVASSHDAPTTSTTLTLPGPGHYRARARAAFASGPPGVLSDFQYFVVR